MTKINSGQFLNEGKIAVLVWFKIDLFFFVYLQESLGLDIFIKCTRYKNTTTGHTEVEGSNPGECR